MAMKVKAVEKLLKFSKCVSHLSPDTPMARIFSK